MDAKRRMHHSLINWQITMNMLPSEFGTTWEVFDNKWCHRTALAYSEADIALGLGTLNRLCPSKVAELTSASVSGAGGIAPKVELGLLLAECEGVSGFHAVLARFNKDERSAYSEFVLVSSLKKLGYRVSFSPPLEGKELDAKCEVNNIPVYFEVVTPERAEASVESEKLVERLSVQLRDVLRACRVEVEIFKFLDERGIGRLINTVMQAPDTRWVPVSSFARFRKVCIGEKLPPVFDGSGAKIVFGGEERLQGDSTGIVIRWNDDDDRAKRIFNDEYHHFSTTVPNVLVINVCAVAGGVDSWIDSIKRLLQPKRNRKVGAIALFKQGVLGPPEAIRRNWKVVVNSYAHVPVPPTLLQGLESLSDPLY